MGVLYAQGEPWPLQLGLWYTLLPVVHYAVPVLVLLLIVRMQQRLESVRFAHA